MADPNLDEHLISSEIVAEGNFLTLKRDHVRLPDHSKGEREYVLHPGAVVIAAVLPNNKIIFVRQFRHPCRQVFLELPAGKIDPNEPHAVTAKRELLEETGYEAQDWVKLGIQHPCIGYSNEVIYLYLAKGLVQSQQQLDEGEFVEVVALSMDQITQKIMSGELTDNKTTAAMYIVEKYLATHG